MRALDSASAGIAGKGCYHKADALSVSACADWGESLRPIRAETELRSLQSGLGQPSPSTLTLYRTARVYFFEYSTLVPRHHHLRLTGSLMTELFLRNRSNGRLLSQQTRSSQAVSKKNGPSASCVEEDLQRPSKEHPLLRPAYP